MRAFWQDVRYGIRLLAGRPGFAAAVVLCLALGIGANTAIFSVINGVLLKPLPFKDADRLCMVWETFRANDRGSVSYPNFENWKARNQAFSSLGGFFPVNHTLTELGEPERIQGGRVTSEFFSTLGVEPVLGRTFVPEEGRAGAENVAVVTYEFWQRRFGGNPNLIGETLTVDQVPFTVVGILPARFSFGVGLEEAEIWTPTALDSVCFEKRGWPRLRIVGRLGSGATLAQGQAQMSEIQQWLAQEYPETSKGHGMRVVPLHTEMVGHVRHLLLLLLGAVGLVLLTACANVANLLLARSTVRAKELAVRAALGARRLRLVRQLLTESMIFGLLGGAAGALLAYWILDALVVLIPAGLPRTANIRIDTGVLLFTVGISLATSLIFGLAPALHASSMNMNAALKEGGRTTSFAGRYRLRAVLVAAQVALSLVLLVGAGLLMRSLHRLVTVDPGFQTKNLLSFQIHLGWDHPSDSLMREDLFGQITERVAALPGVESASAASSLPMRRAEGFPFTIKGRPEPPRRERPGALYK
ncbi:MAG: FtsX-like permease family protein, partial [bacterium]|nr:FtsX-like permease family protein [bacterium]